MTKKLFSLFILSAMVLSLFSLVSCSKKDQDNFSRMTVDINPSIEFMLDSENKVAAVTALNDDGSLLIAGEAFVGKTAEDAAELVITLATETGYLVKGNVEATENTVKISVSGDTRQAEKLKNAVVGQVESALAELDIQGKVEKVEAMKMEGLRQLALSTSLYTEEDINAMTEEQLLKVIAAGRVETALLLTEEMRRAYYSAKSHQISFAEREETAKIIEAMGGIYALTHTAYKTALSLYSTAITELDEFRYDALLAPDSAYQIALARLRDAKAEVLAQRSYTASLTVGGEEYASATLTLQASEKAYDAALLAFETVGEQMNASLESLIAALRTAEDKLKELETTLFDKNVEEELKAHAKETEVKLNQLKDSFFESFETAHAEDLAKIEQALLQKKQQLKDEIGK